MLSFSLGKLLLTNRPYKLNIAYLKCLGQDMFQITKYLCRIYTTRSNLLTAFLLSTHCLTHVVEWPIFYEWGHVTTQVLDFGEYKSCRDEGLLNLLNQLAKSV